jgi:UDP-N-acetylmuramate dehydrogenase
MKILERPAKKCAFRYRSSIFKREGHAEIVLSATLQLAKGDSKAIAKSIKEKIDYRIKNHPMEYPNIGSIFKNVPLRNLYRTKSKPYKVGVASQSIKYRGSAFSVKTDPFPVISAAKLISESGLRAVSYGGAMISSKHPNFIVNVLNAGSDDVKSLMGLAKAQVFKKFGVVLKEEVQII